MEPLTDVFEWPQSHIQLIEVTPRLITLSLSMKTTEASCPLCGQLSHRVHGRYQRTLQELSWCGKALRLPIQVRRFFCDHAASARKLFAERFPALTSVYARRTTRCTQALTELGFALEGRPGARLSASLGLPSNRMTLLRILCRTPDPSVHTPRILGVDEWAAHRRKIYGTLLVDLEQGIPIDLFPNRQAATFATWLQQHPGVLVISRDLPANLLWERGRVRQKPYKWPTAFCPPESG